MLESLHRFHTLSELKTALTNGTGSRGGISEVVAKKTPDRNYLC
jgi:hypothetical protein